MPGQMANDNFTTQSNTDLAMLLSLELQLTLCEKPESENWRILNDEIRRLRESLAHKECQANPQ